MKNLLINLIKVFGKYIFGGILFFVTGALYYIIWRYGIESFYNPMAGILITIIVTALCILYVLMVRNKKSNKTPIGK